jgi:uncharacterized protein with von Willebrand factor type A (vWA) domain
MSLKIFNHLYKDDKNFKGYSEFFATHLEGIDIKELIEIPKDGEYIDKIEELMHNLFENHGSKQSIQLKELKGQINKLEEKLEKLMKKKTPPLMTKTKKNKSKNKSKINTHKSKLSKIMFSPP